VTDGGVRMRLGYNTNGLQNHRLEDAIALLAAEGYAAIAWTPDVMHLDPSTCTAAMVADVARRLADAGLTPVVETGARFLLDPMRKHEPTLMTRDASLRERRLDFYHHAAAVGRDLGASVLSFWTGIDRVGGGDAAAWMLDGIAQTCDLVRRHGLVPALEPEPGMAVATVADYAAVVAALGEEAPMLCLDVGHLYVTDEGDVADVIAAQRERIVQVHLEDMRRGVHEHLVPGDGEVDFGAVRAALHAAAYGGAVCFELSRSSHMAPDAVRRCRETWVRADPAHA
jgi:sugar phosphate isomerase/epimerase